MKTNEKIVIGTVGLGLFAAAASLAMQPPAGWGGTLAEFHFPLAADIFMALIHIGAALLFILSLSAYKAKLRLAFAGIVLGILLTGLGTVQLPLLDAFDMWSSVYVSSGIIALPFLLSGLAYYFGASSIGRLVGEKSIVTNRLAVIFAAIALSLLSTLLPHAQTSTPEMTYDVTSSIYVWILVLCVAAAIVFLRVKTRIGAHYKTVMAWLSLALLSSAACVVVAILDRLFYDDVRSPLTLLLNIVIVVAGFVWLKAGYTFTRTKEF